MLKRHLRLAKTGPDGLSAEMQRLGFTDYEARVYIHLLQDSPATAYEVSKAAGVPRSNTYAAFHALAQRGVVQPVSEDPVRYAPVDPEIMLDRIATSTRELCDGLASRLSKVAKPGETHFVWTVRGDRAVDEKIRRMIGAAHRHIWIKAAETVVRQHKEELRAAAERGVDILIVLFGEDAEQFRFSDHTRVYLHEGNGVRLGTADNLFTIAVDHDEVLAANAEGEVYAAYTQNPSIVTMAESVIRHEFYLAELFARMGGEIERIFGPHLLELRAACFTPEQLLAFKERIGVA